MTAQLVRDLLEEAAYYPALWPEVAGLLSEALRGNYTSLLELGLPTVNVTEYSLSPPSTSNSLNAVICADSRPFDNKVRPPTIREAAQDILTVLQTQSATVGEAYFRTGFCDVWPATTKSYYGGPLTLPKNTLSTPLLILSNALDPITPLFGAVDALHNLGATNARLVEQNGTSHSTHSQPSACTQKIVRPSIFCLLFYRESELAC